MTSFTRIVVVLGFVRNALATQQTPPNRVIIGLALFLTFFIMAPIYSRVNETAILPSLEDEITSEYALATRSPPLERFMVQQTTEKVLPLFVNLSDGERPETMDDLPMHVLVPAFVISELKTEGVSKCLLRP
ncbi:EscR/YscR/HrcR family type III secretion system export apparatus protein [Dethiobacter alkaliphilus]|uniref:Flagellar biosynthetic protein FliP n=1 Tax=Dethiobacter alkaliphilus AHT 1 TaxID=555088 RepID=C0GJG8_DETAL|nr:flagellar biosynthetic protein FliP [Dethiobacter alkaliphilus]EEG76515.1 type III secretion system inner membrane P protein [Dethiobacter alkaliphilus AHT 1]